MDWGGGYPHQCNQLKELEQSYIYWHAIVHMDKESCLILLKESVCMVHVWINCMQRGPLAHPLTDDRDDGVVAPAIRYWAPPALWRWQIWEPQAHRGSLLLG